ncbi:two-component system regulatory protein YycI [Pontibacillus litoralis]|uniref:Regulatory protein YycH-like domain-containing protein n=1 Tax=Pontibacillus litoralis JSM 072002 TaxID=1385512 RepID=A0A0A5FYG0_9BACI|nr:two-component system regulatory protein YycI [Pontibacillus litoralis]KGX84834.1 hypothetical protein N784_11700 [Pontibacillus litoralis JSM 072002]
MQWGQIKTLFIICFLVLDVFLAQQFMQKREQSEYGPLDDSTFEEKLEAANIGVGEVPKDAVKQAYISAKRHKFTEEDVEAHKDTLRNQTTKINNGDVLLAAFDKPISIDVTASAEVMESMMSNKVINGDQYAYWNWDEENQTLLFFQTYKGKPIYYNASALLMVFVNDDKELIGYAQTMLEDIHTTAEPQELIKPMTAIETLYNNNELYEGDTISSMELGYHTLVPLENGVQVFSPTWKMNIKDEENKRYLYVNGVHGQLIETEEERFIQDVMIDLSIASEIEGWSDEQ